ncbi:MAG TPA: PEP/pyruvate-binding domain-containing protein [Micromonosporaceae bacterium]
MARSADIRARLAGHDARRRLPGLTDGAADPARTGAKFAALAAHAHEFPVPPGFCVPADEFADAITVEQAGALRDAFGDLRATVGAFVTETTQRIARIAAEIRLPEPLRALVAVRLADEFTDPASRVFAVRSSGLDEDTQTSSLAGIHATVLGVRGVDGVLAAIEHCWRSYYAAPAVAARLRAGDVRWQPRLAVFVQEQIPAHLAGVAFTDRDEVVVEYVTGLADQMVAGAEVPSRVTLGTAAGSPPDPRLAEVAALARRLRRRCTGDIDVEWAIDGSGLHLIQVRPRTDRPAATHDDAPALDVYRLYVEDPPPNVPLGEVARVYASQVAKRGPVYRLAAECDVPTGRGWLLRFNGLGLHAPATVAALRAALAEGGADRCVLDLADTMRQIVVAKSEVIPRLIELTGVTGRGTRMYSAVVRDFVSGEIGLITRLAGDGLLVEYTDEGLMALNRGTAGAATIVVGDLRQPIEQPGNLVAPADPAASRLVPHLTRLASFTRRMVDRYGDTTLEWVYADGQPYLVDFSVLGGDPVTVVPDSAVVSAGTARGPLLTVDDDEVLRRLSIGPAISLRHSVDLSDHDGLEKIVAAVAASPRPPIVRVRRPYAVLSVLIGSVAGFVFERGSILGHLPILLREAGVPAVTYAGPGLVDGDEVVISDGTVAFGVTRAVVDA